MGGSVTMKEAFRKLPEEKRARVVDAALREFGRHGYDSASLDRLVRAAGISKGGLYEYIGSKQDLFVYLAEHSYDALYRFISDHIGGESGLPADLVERVALVSRVAVDFYLKHPEIIGFISRSSDTNDLHLKRRIQEIFENHYDGIFGDADWSVLEFDRERVLGLLKWLLVRTRNSFLRSRKALRNKALCKAAYLEEWDFHLRILRRGIYKEGLGR